MISLYLGTVIFAAVMGLLAWARIKSVEAHAAQSDAAQAEQRAAAAEHINRQDGRTVDHIERAQQQRHEQQRRQQLGIDAGRRDAFDSDGF
jgi:type VI protein secretion system component VasK